MLVLVRRVVRLRTKLQLLLSLTAVSMSVPAVQFTPRMRLLRLRSERSWGMLTMRPRLMLGCVLWFAELLWLVWLVQLPCLWWLRLHSDDGAAR